MRSLLSLHRERLALRGALIDFLKSDEDPTKQNLVVGHFEATRTRIQLAEVNAMINAWGKRSDSVYRII